MRAEASRCLLARVDKGQLGKKTDHGLYAWTADKAQKGAAGTPPAQVAARFVKPLIDRVKHLVATGVVVDAVVSCGTGFVPFTVGPLNYRKAEAQ